MYWGAFLLFIVTIYAGLKCYKLFESTGLLKFTGFCLAASILALTQASILIDGAINGSNLSNYTLYIVEWGHIISLALVLSSLAVFIRDSKPVFAQFPLIYTALPVLIVLSYALVSNTYALKDWLISIYQGGAIVVALLMYGIYTYRRSSYAVVLAGSISFLITFILYWYVPNIAENYSWLWKLFLSLSIIIFIYGFERVDALKAQEVPNR